MDAVFKMEIIKVDNGKKVSYEDTLIREIKLDIYINSKKVGSLMSTPTDLKELSVGYLISENIVEKIDDIRKLDIIAETENIYKATIEAKANQNSIEKLDTDGVIVSGCGRATSNQISKAIDATIIKNSYSITASLLQKEMADFYTQCPLYEQTGCVHTAKFYIDEKNYFIGEDIAQHNTIDKAIGKALLSGADVTKGFLMVSGRLSSEMVAKAVMHQIPILASRTASTCRGVNIARKFGLTLIGFVRGKKMNIYANPKRIEI